MKRCIGLVCLVIFCFCSVSCEKAPAMSELLVYEGEARTYALRIRDGDTYAVTLGTGEGREAFTFSEGELAELSVCFDADGVSLSYRAMKFPITSPVLLRATHWRELFRLGEKNLLWQIRRETLGGIAVYECRADGVILYLDAGSRLPLKITSGEVEIDVLSCEETAE